MAITIVYATNDAYTTYTGISIVSLLQNANPRATYDVRILYTALSLASKRMLENLATPYASITLIDVSAWFDRLQFNMKNVYGKWQNIKEALYRFYIAEMQDVDKVLYLDGDTIVSGDVAALYETALGNNVLGAVQHPKHVQAWTNEQIQTCVQPFLHQTMHTHLYFNSGVLLIDTKKFNHAHITQTCLTLLEQENKFTCPDQDVLNIALHQQVQPLDEAWNVMPNYYAPSATMEHEAPNIIHYVGADKPWLYVPQGGYGAMFWAYAEQAEKKGIVLKKDTLCHDYAKFFASAVFPYHRIEKNANVVFYGGGFAGFVLRMQNEYTGYCNAVLHCDKNNNDETLACHARFALCAPQQLQNAHYDYVLVCVKEQAVGNAITNDLIALGVPPQKIVWERYFAR